MLKTLFQHSGWKVLFWAFVGWVGESVVEWAAALTLADPWGKILAGAAAFVSGALRLLVAHYREPTVDATKLPDSFIAAHGTDKEVARVEAAKERAGV